jgi:ubiquitin carboxyl-terminal hydrolase L3
MNPLAYRLGLSPELAFHEPYSLTEPELTALVPRPVYALLFLYPEDALVQVNDAPTEYEGSGTDEPVLWFRQTIGHTCGFMGLMHCLLNSEATKHIIADSFLDKLQQQAIPLKPVERADLLYSSEELERIYKEASQTGDSHVPTLEEPVDYAFAAFVKGKNNHLYQMEGWKKGPIDRGVLADDEDLFSPKALELGPLQIINQAKASEGRFSCIVLTDNLD